MECSTVRHYFKQLNRIISKKIKQISEWPLVDTPPCALAWCARRHYLPVIQQIQMNIGSNNTFSNLVIICHPTIFSSQGACVVCEWHNDVAPWFVSKWLPLLSSLSSFMLGRNCFKAHILLMLDSYLPRTARACSILPAQIACVPITRVLQI